MKWADRRRLLVGVVLVVAALRAVWMVCNALGRALAAKADRHPSTIRPDSPEPIVRAVRPQLVQRNDWIVLPSRSSRSTAEPGLGKWL